MRYDDGRIEILPKGSDPRFSRARKAFQVKIEGKWLCDWRGGPISEYRTEEAALKAARTRTGVHHA